MIVRGCKCSSILAVCLMSGGLNDRIFIRAFSSQTPSPQKSRRTGTSNDAFDILSRLEDMDAYRKRIFRPRTSPKPQKSRATVSRSGDNIRPLSPPFPDGLCGGTLLSIPPGKHYDVYNLANPGGGPLPILPPRPVDIWLPPEYQTHPDKKFPVLYCHDGQNAIVDSSSWTGSSWRLAGALTRLSERNFFQTAPSSHSSPALPILVLLPSAEGDYLPGLKRRHLEYGDTSQPFARSHADFVATVLKPLVDAQFRTLSDPQNTSVMGTSLGGQAAMHLMLRHPTLFSNAVCLSPAISAGILAAIATAPVGIFSGKKIYIDNGGDAEDTKVPFFDVLDHVTPEHWWNPGYWWLDTQLQPGIDALRMVLDMKNVDYVYRKFAGARHNERAWARRIHEPLLCLFGDDSA